MNKPKAKVGVPYYDLLEVLKYIDENVPGFEKRIWRILCDCGYIKNDIVTGIYFEGLITEDTPDEVIEGIEFMFKEFPDIKNGKVDFSISW